MTTTLRNIKTSGFIIILMVLFLPNLVWSLDIKNNSVNFQNPTKSEILITKKSLGKIQFDSNFEEGYTKKYTLKFIEPITSVNGAKNEVRLTEIPTNHVVKNIPAKISPLGSFKPKPYAVHGIKNIDLKAGLPNNRVRAVVERKNGEIWGTTTGGIFRLMTGKIVGYYNLNGFPDFPITDMVEFDGKLYIGSFGNGIYEFDNGILRILNVKTGFESDHILDLEVKGNDLYIATYGNGIYRLSLTRQLYKVNLPELENTSKVVNSMHAFKNKLYFTTDNGIGVIDEENYNELNIREKYGLSPANVFCDSKGVIWFSTASNQLFKLKDNQLFELIETNLEMMASFIEGKSGLISIGHKNGVSTLFNDSLLLDYGTSNGLVNSLTNKIIQDSYNNLWICSNTQGINLLLPSSFTNIEAGTLGLMALCESPQNELIYENKNGGGLIFNFNGQKKSFSHPRLQSIRNIVRDPKTGSYWICTLEQLFELTTDLELYQFNFNFTDQRNLGNLLNLTISPAGEIVLSTYNAGVVVLQNNAALYYPDWYDETNSFDNSARVDSKGDIYACNSRGNLGVFKGNSLEIYNLTDSLANIVAFSTTEIGLDSVLVATSKGLYILNQKKVRKVSLNPIIDQARITSVFLDKTEQILWLATSNGLYSYSIQTKKTELYNEEFGLASASFETTNYKVIGKNVYWISSEGIVKYTPFNFSSKNSKRPLTINNVNLVDDNLTTHSFTDQDIAYDSIFGAIPYGLVLPYNYNTVELSVDAKNWGRENLTEITYKINNSTSEFEVAEDGIIRLQNLTPGFYEIYITAKFPQAPNSYLSYSFTIEKPYYLKSWFIIIIGFFIVLIVFILLKQIKSYNFDKLENYNDGKFIITKTRVLIISNIILLFVIDYFQAEIFNTYEVFWPINGAMILISLIFYYLTYLKQFSAQFFNNSTKLIYTLFCILFLSRVILNDFSPIIAIESSLCIIFAPFIFKDLKNVVLFATLTATTAFIIINFGQGAPELKTLFISAALQAILVIITFTILETKRLTKVLFSDKLLQYSTQIVIVSDLKGKIVYANNHLFNLTGLTEEQVLGDGWWNYLGYDKEQILAFFENKRNQISSETLESYTDELKIKDKKVIVRWRDSIFEDKYVMSIGEDVTIETIQRSELQRLSSVAKNVINGVVILDVNHKIEWVNDSFATLFEYSLDELLGKRPIDFFSGNSTSSEAIERVKENLQEKEFELKQYTKSGQPLDVLLHQNAVYDEQGLITNYVMIVTDVTLRKREQEKYKFIIENAGEIIYTANHRGEFTFVSPSVEQIMGYKDHELTGVHFLTLISEDFQTKTQKFYRDQFEQQTKTSSLEFQVYKKNRELIWVSQTIQLVKSDDGKISFQGVVKNIQDLKLLEINRQELVKTQQKYNSFLYQQSLIPVENFGKLDSYLNFLLDELSNLITINRISVWIYKSDYIVCRTSNFNTKKDTRLHRKEYPKYFTAIETGLVIEAIDARKHPKTKELTENYFIPNDIYSLYDFPIRIDGKIVGVLCIEDTKRINERASSELSLLSNVCDLISLATQSFIRFKTEKKIKESEANFRLLNETINDVFWLVDFEKLEIAYISPSCKTVFGKAESHYYENISTWRSYVIPEDVSLIESTHQNFNKTGNYEIEYRINVDGTIKWIREKSFIINDEHGKPIKSSGVSIDITHQKIVEQEIKQLSLVAEKTKNGVAIADGDGRILWANESYLNMFEIKLNELIGNKPHELFASKNEAFKEQIKTYNKEKVSYVLEIENETFKGNKIWIELHSTSIRNEYNVPIQVEIVNNITERKDAERIIQAQTDDILASIRYAQRIQNALLTPTSFFDELPIDYFLHYKPKNIIGGDFYWGYKKDNKAIIAIGDCTGHGVPGAIMTSLGINGLINSMVDADLDDPSEMLNSIDRYIKSILLNSSEFSVDDGMDLGIISIDLDKNSAIYSGAGRPLILVENGEIIKIGNSRRSIGSKVMFDPFENTAFNLTENTSLYLFSDGIIDQFNPETNRRLGSKKLNEMFIFMENLNMHEKSVYFTEMMNEHQKNGDQTDDMVLFSLKLKMIH
jgi:PAS domain S-box-containing protein